MGNYCSISLIENRKQFGTSEAMAVSKKLGFSHSMPQNHLQTLHDELKYGQVYCLLF